MSLARGIERRLENLVDGVSASVFRGTMHPVTIASRLVRQLEFLAADSPSGTHIPNDLTVVLNPGDLDAQLDREALGNELADVVSAASDEYGWRLAGPVQVSVKSRPDVPKGILQCSGSEVSGEAQAWGQLISTDGSVALPLTANRIIIGRALDADVRLSNEQVSRHHTRVSRVDGVVTAEDLQSANGTMVDGTRIATSPAPLLPGSILTIGDLAFTFRPVS